MGFLCVCQQGEFKSTIKKRKMGGGGNSMSKTFLQKVRGGGGGGGALFSCHIFPSIFVIAFVCRFSAQEAQKHH
jgi:hypothetical protein